MNADLVGEEVAIVSIEAASDAELLSQLREVELQLDVVGNNQWGKLIVAQMRSQQLVRSGDEFFAFEVFSMFINDGHNDFFI